MRETDLGLLIRAARAGGEIAKGYFGSDPRVWDKADGAGPVTEADLAVNRLLHDTLPAARPGYGWLSEESDDSAARLGADHVFVVDPIDGTRAFIEGSKDWAISLAVVSHGRVTAGAVYLPVRDLMFTASAGGGAQLNGQTIHVSDTATLAGANVLSNKPSFAPRHWAGGTPPSATRHFRSSLAYRLCLVAQGRFDAMITLRPTWEWDVAAGTLIVAEAGGSVRTMTDTAPAFNNPHPQVNGLLAGGTVRALLQDRLARPAA